MNSNNTYVHQREMKLTLVSVNGRSRFLMCPVDPDGRVRIGDEMLRRFGIRRGDCIRFG